jgi:hypothetical protein
MSAGGAAKDDKSTPSSRPISFVDSFRSQTATWLVAFLIGILTIFSSKLSENIKFAVNKADLRTKYYEELVSDVSEFNFEAEFWAEEVRHNRTTEPSLKQTVSEYDTSITKLRKKEWVYQSWIKRYWEEKQAAAFSQYVSTVKAFDLEAHSLNDEIEAVVNKKKDKFDQSTSEAAAQRLEKALKKVQDASRDLIQQLE